MPGGAIAFASDYTGFDLKQFLKRDLQEAGHEGLDLGSNSTASADDLAYGTGTVAKLSKGCTT